MTAEQLEELLGKVTQGEWRVEVDESAAQVTGYPIIETDDYVIVGTEGMYGVIEQDFTNATLIALAPSLARRVIAAEKLVEALIIIKQLCNPDGDIQYLADAAITAYREVSK